MTVDEALEKIQNRIDKCPEPGPDDEETGYRQGLDDAARIIQGLEPRFRKGWSGWE